jgi:hypothetical protein
MKKCLLLLPIVSILLALQCKKHSSNPPPDNPYGLPDASHTGANIFACRINGQNWISQSGIYKIGGGVNSDTVFCFGKIYGNDYFEDLILNINGGAAENSQYDLNETGKYFIRISTNKTCLGNLGSNVLNTKSVTGISHLTKIDKIKKIISGSFDCKIPIPGCDTLTITDGRFDIQY